MATNEVTGPNFIEVDQTDQFGFFQFSMKIYELPLAPGLYSVPYGAFRERAPAVPEGMVARNQGDGWSVVEDHRGTAFYLLSNGEKYEFGRVVQIEGEDVSYEGGGPVPSWLTDVAPQPVPDLPEGEAGGGS